MIRREKSLILLATGILAIARARTLIDAISALREFRVLCDLDFMLFLARFSVQAASGFLALLGGCVLSAHDFLHRGGNAALINEARDFIVPGATP